MSANRNLNEALAKFRQEQQRLAQGGGPPKKPKTAPRTSSAKGKGEAKGKKGAAAPAGAAAKGKAGAPLAKQVKDVFDLLLSGRQALSPAELKERTQHDASPGTPLHAALCSHPKVALQPDGRFAYKAEHTISDRAGLRQLVESRPDGLLLSSVKDAYEGVAADMEALRAEGQLWALPGTKGGEVVLFPRAQDAASRVSEAVADLWHQCEVPEDPEAMEAELRAAKLRPCRAPGEEKKRAPAAPKEKKKRKWAPRHVTNVHLPGLFDKKLLATSID